jgi:hypothetical protein
MESLQGSMLGSACYFVQGNNAEEMNGRGASDIRLSGR